MEWFLKVKNKKIHVTTESERMIDSEMTIPGDFIFKIAKIFLIDDENGQMIFYKPNPLELEQIQEKIKFQFFNSFRDGRNYY